MNNLQFSVADAAAADAAELVHLFVGKGYAKLMQLQAGELAKAHKHNRDHVSVLLLGTVHLTIDGVAAALRAPATITVRAGELHEILALEPVLWACVWDNPDGLETQTAFESSVIADATFP
jgi:quercetin dioxygenase-like cupin family protein